MPWIVRLGNAKVPRVVQKVIFSKVQQIVAILCLCLWPNVFGNFRVLEQVCCPLKGGGCNKNKNIIQEVKDNSEEVIIGCET